MSDFKYNQEEFNSIIDEIVPSYQRSIIKDAMGLTTDSEFDQIGLELTGEKREIGLILPTSSPSSTKPENIWAAIKNEVYDYLCTKSKKYTKERNEAGATIKQIITLIATTIGAMFSITTALITGAVTIALMSALKIGKNAWCSLNEPE